MQAPFSYEKSVLLGFFLRRQKLSGQTQRAAKWVYVCEMIFAGALPPFSRTAV